MGRKKIYNTENELSNAKKKWWKNYYYKNQKLVKEKNLKRYHDKKLS